ncbi:M15 family metallopeptidase [Aquimarina agarivorans]|uniref:M15 family metallopeptidase n=1 Tax=Aquimarina agarivorans TaxID=980584 RepID=UPI000248FCE2|nr:M15 family metallopeptidase [Aquimarina agarivorans]
MKYFLPALLIFSLSFLSCNQTITPIEKIETAPTASKLPLNDTISSATAIPPIKIKNLASVSDTSFIKITDYNSNFFYDLRYATHNNFLKEKVYNCGECYTRAKTAKALIKANNFLMKKGFKIKFFDCYRPNSVQYKMWKIMPNPQYVANPKKGSIHNKGGAVDITLTDLNGKEVDMGTDFDFFGWKAYHTNITLPKKVLENRKLLKTTMERFGFWSIRTEWWHYNLKGTSHFKIANFEWNCSD